MADDTFDPYANPFVSGEDAERLRKLSNRVLKLMWDGEWRTLPEIRKEVFPGETQSIGAALRKWRMRYKDTHYVLLKRRDESKKGLWEYQFIKQRDWDGVTGKIFTPGRNRYRTAVEAIRRHPDMTQSLQKAIVAHTGDITYYTVSQQNTGESRGEPEPLH